MNSYVRFFLSSPLFLSFGFAANLYCGVGQTYFVSLFNADLQAAYGLSNGGLAVLYGTATIISSACLLFAGRMMDRVDLRLFIIGTCLTVAVSCWFLANTTAVWMVFVAIFALRFSGQGLLGMTAQVAMGRYFDEQRGRAAALSNAGIAFSYGLLPPFGAWLLTHYDWREAWTLVGWGFAIVILPTLLLQLSGHGERHRTYTERLASLAGRPSEEGKRQWTRAEVLRDSRFWLLQPAMLAMPCVIFSIQFHQLFIVEAKGWSIAAFASGYTLFAACVLVCNMIAGPLIDRAGSWAIINVMVWPLIPVLVLLGFFDGGWVIPTMMLFGGVTSGLMQVVFVTLWAEMYGTKHLGAIRSVNVFLNVGMASLVMALTGWLIDRGATVAELCTGGLVYLVLSVLMLAIARRMDRMRSSTAREAA